MGLSLNDPIRDSPCSCQFTEEELHRLQTAFSLKKVAAVLDTLRHPAANLTGCRPSMIRYSAQRRTSALAYTFAAFSRPLTVAYSPA